MKRGELARILDHSVLKPEATDFDVRTMTVDLPLAGMFNQPNPYVSWYANPTEITGSIRDLPTIQQAFIHVNIPTPAAIATLLGGTFLPSRRRRKAVLPLGAAMSALPSMS